MPDFHAGLYTESDDGTTITFLVTGMKQYVIDKIDRDVINWSGSWEKVLPPRTSFSLRDRTQYRNIRELLESEGFSREESTN